jgi:hypothetical protein
MSEQLKIWLGIVGLAADFAVMGYAMYLLFL